MEISVLIFIACGIWMVLLGLYFMFLRPSLLPEDLHYMETRGYLVAYQEL